MFGSHLSIAGGLHNALTAAAALGMQAVQVFTKNQQQWRCPPVSAEAVAVWRKHRREAGMEVVVSHASYLINLASPVDELWRKSIELFVEELTRCRLLGIPNLVIHPGAHMGAGEEAGLKRVAEALDAAHRRVRAKGVTTCLEITAGQGTCLGHRLEHLARVMELARSPERLAVCLDTAHLFAGGYDFRGRKYAGFMREVDRVIGVPLVKVWHLNDSKRPLGSRVDRHDHIGRGMIGLAGFRPIVRDERFRRVPKILETPKEKDADGREWDEVNLQTLVGLMKG